MAASILRLGAENIEVLVSAPPVYPDPITKSTTKLGAESVELLVSGESYTPASVIASITKLGSENIEILNSAPQLFPDPVTESIIKLGSENIELLTRGPSLVPPFPKPSYLRLGAENLEVLNKAPKILVKPVTQSITKLGAESLEVLTDAPFLGEKVIDKIKQLYVDSNYIYVATDKGFVILTMLGETVVKPLPGGTDYEYPRQGLVLEYLFKGNLAIDTSGNSNDGVSYGAALSYDRGGNKQYACFFPGGNYITAPDIDLPPQNRSILAWVRRNRTSSYYQFIVAKNDAGYSTECDFGITSDGTLQATWRQNGVGVDSLFGPQINDFSNWHLVGCVFSNAEVLLYLDGQLVASKATSIINSLNNELWYIGRRINVGSERYWLGAIDDLLFYDRALADSDIETIYNKSKVDVVAGYPTKDNMVRFLFNGNADDSTGGERHGTVFGALLTKNRFGLSDGAYSFDGVDDYISFPAPPDFGANNEKTIILWLKVSGTNSTTAGLIASRHPTDSVIRGFVLGLTSDNKVIYFHTGAASVTAANPISTYSYTMVTLTTSTNGNNVSIYYDNNPIPQVQGNVGTALSDDLTDIFTIGREVGAYCNIIIDDIVGYTRQLTLTEIIDIYNKTKP